MSKHNNIYNILGKLSALEPTPAPQKSILGELSEPPKMKDLATRLNERYLAEKDLGKHNNATTGFAALSKKAGGGNKAKGDRIAGAQLAKMRAKGQVEESEKPDFLDMDKDGDKKEPMKKAVSDKKKNPFAKKVNENELEPHPGAKYNEPHTWPKGKRPGKYNTQTGQVSHWDERTDTERERDWDSMIEGEVDEDMLTPKEKKFAKLAPPKDKVTYADKIAGAKKHVEEETDQHEYDHEGEMADNDLETAEDAAEELRSILDTDENLPEWVQAKITKAVDYLDTARDYMQSKDSDEDMNEGEYKDSVNKSKIPAYQRKAKGGDDWKLSQADLDDEASKSPTSRAGLEKAKQRLRDQGVMEAFPTVDDAKKRAEQERGTGKFDKQTTSTGTRYTRKSDTFADDGDDGETKASDAPKKKGRPKKNSGPERVTSKAWKHKGGRKVNEAYKPVKLDTFVEDALLEMENLLLSEKAVSKAQQKFMGMVHAAQKGEKAASPEVAKVAKSMGEKDAEDFASTKHKGLPQHVKESIAFESADPALNTICHRYGKECKDFMTSGVMDGDLYHALHDHYYDNMPAFVKRGDNTKEWVEDKFYADMGGDHHDAGPDALSTIPPRIDLNKDHELDELAALAGLGRQGMGESSCNMTLEGEMCPVHGFAECWGGSGMMESKEKKAKKDYDGDGEVESEKDEVIGSRRKAAGLDESAQLDECGEMSPMGSMVPQGTESGMNISGSMDTKTGRKTLTVTADGEAAEELAQMLKMAGVVGGHEPEQAPVAQAVPKIVAIGHQHGEMMGEAFANEPDQEYASTDEILDQGGDLNRKKKQFADKPKSGDNPIATKESVQLEARLARLYDSIKIRK